MPLLFAPFLCLPSRATTGYIESGDVDDQLSRVVFSAAGVAVCQTYKTNGTHDDRDDSQAFFAEHTDDIVSLHTVRTQDEALVATGEVGKKPSIHVYSWDEEHSAFASVTCLSGYFSKAVVQVVFSSPSPTDDLLLFAVGQDYKVAVYNVDRSAKSFGRMLGSMQGPKDKVLHVCASWHIATPEGGKPIARSFLSCGQKHAIIWQMTKSGKPKQIDVKLGKFRNLLITSCCSTPSGDYIVGTNKGDLLVISPDGKAREATDVDAASSKAAELKHDGKGVNALWSGECAGRFVIVSGATDGKVRLSLSLSFSFSLSLCVLYIINHSWL